ncbi:hypothetical protein FACS1894172_04320 [Spirochaetia bacterium]|nr:hypothetical protein FACS1894172_04320 [Spirochaetia bacterium]
MGKKNKQNIQSKVNKTADVTTQKKQDLQSVEEILSRLPKLEEEQDALRKEIEALEKTIEPRESLQAELNNKKEYLQSTKAEIKTKETEKADRQVYLQKSDSDKDKITKAIKKLENEIEQKRKEKNKVPGQIDKNNKSGGSSLEYVTGGKQNKSTQNTAERGISVPTLQQLPLTGILYHDNNKKDYLAISDWEDYDKARQEAKRLHAILCAERSENG